MSNKGEFSLNHVVKNNCFTVRKLGDGTLQIACVVIDLDKHIHTDKQPRCDDPTCPCNATPVDDTTMPDDIRKYYEPIEERSFDHPGVPAPCWENVEEDEEYPIGRPRGHEWNRDCPCDQCEAHKWEDNL